MIRVLVPTLGRPRLLRGFLDSLRARAAGRDWRVSVAINAAIDEPEGRDYEFLNDDDLVVASDGWDRIVADRFALAGDAPRMVSHSLDYACPFVNEPWRRGLGFLAPAGFECWHVDTWWTDVADGAGIRDRVPDLRVEHAGPDDDRARVLARFFSVADERLYHERRPTTRLEIEHLRALATGAP
jgi:hypothetical protein